MKRPSTHLQPAAAAMIFYSAQIRAQFKVIVTIPNREEKKHSTPTDSPESTKYPNFLQRPTQIQ